MFLTTSHLYPSLICANKTGAYPSGATLEGLGYQGGKNLNKNIFGVSKQG